MTRAKWFEKGYGESGFSLGIVSEAMHDRYEHYKSYLVHRKTLPHMEAVEQVAEEARCSATTVWHSVSFFLKSSGNNNG